MSTKPMKERSKPPILRWTAGMMMSAVFSSMYFLAPFYMISALILLIKSPTSHYVWAFVSPIVISALIKPVPMPWLIRRLTPMLDYFDYEEIHESKPRNVTQEINDGTNFLLICQPHGAVSFVGICSAIDCPTTSLPPTAVADALLKTPILKHVLGIFGLVSASKPNMIRQLKKPGAEGTLVLYVGGMAELFLSSEHQEQLYLKERKGFIKLALTTGVDIVPVYLFGNTTVLSVLKTGVLASLSRKLQVSLTYIWGKWYLPIPRSTKLLYVAGQPLGMPHIEQPTQQVIDDWHAMYLNEVRRLFDTYKERVPEYKHKTLEIL